MARNKKCEVVFVCFTSRVVEIYENIEMSPLGPEIDFVWIDFSNIDPSSVRSKSFRKRELRASRIPNRHLVMR